MPVSAAPAALERAIDALKSGRIAVLVDDHRAAGRASLLLAAELVSPEAIAFMDRHAGGMTCLALTPERCAELSLEALAPGREGEQRPPFTVSVDAADVTSTGVSSSDRARTVEVALDPAAGPHQLVRPGHVFPLRAQRGGVLQQAGQTEAAVDLARLAGLLPAAVSCEILAPELGREPAELSAFCARHGLPLVSVAAVVAHRRLHERLVERIVVADLPTAHGHFEVIGYRSLDDDSDHLALVRGQLAGMEDPLVHIHLACPLGDIFRSGTCRCREELEEAMAMVDRAGEGVLVYVRGGELGRFEHDSRSPSAADPRSGEIAAQILDDLGLRSVRILPPNGPQAEALAHRGLAVSTLNH